MEEDSDLAKVFSDANDFSWERSECNEDARGRRSSTSVRDPEAAVLEEKPATEWLECGNGGGFYKDWRSWNSSGFHTAVTLGPPLEVEPGHRSSFSFISSNSSNVIGFPLLESEIVFEKSRSGTGDWLGCEKGSTSKGRKLCVFHLPGWSRLFVRVMERRRREGGLTIQKESQNYLGSIQTIYTVGQYAPILSSSCMTSHCSSRYAICQAGDRYRA